MRAYECGEMETEFPLEFGGLEVTSRLPDMMVQVSPEELSIGRILLSCAIAPLVKISVSSISGRPQRIISAARRFSTREGSNRKDNVLPDVLLDSPFSEGSSKNHVVVKEDHERVLEDYYEARNWDQDSIPPSDP